MEVVRAVGRLAPDLRDQFAGVEPVDIPLHSNGTTAWKAHDFVAALFPVVGRDAFLEVQRLCADKLFALKELIFLFSGDDLDEFVVAFDVDIGVDVKFDVGFDFVAVALLVVVVVAVM